MNTLIQIAELANFKCLMGDCPDTCCKGWEIPVDSRTLNLWEGNPKSQDFLSKLNILQPSDKPSPCSAKIKLKSDLSCSFLKEDSLCSIHSNLGEDLLSHTCKSYPRELNRYWGMLERSYALSCPEVANICLNQIEPLSLAYQEEANEHWIFREIQEPQEIKPDIIPKLYHLRTLCLLKAQDRSLNIKERLDVLSKVALRSTLNHQEVAALPAREFDSYFNKLQEILYKKSNILKESDQNLEKLTDLIKPYAKKGSLLHSKLSGDAHLIKESQDHEIILEHVLFILLFRSLFPFCSDSTEFTFLEIKNTMNLLRTLIERTKEKVKIIQQAMRLLDHYEDLRIKLRTHIY